MEIGRDKSRAMGYRIHNSVDIKLIDYHKNVIWNDSKLLIKLQNHQSAIQLSIDAAPTDLPSIQKIIP